MTAARLALFVTNVDALGGSERQTLLLAQTLARRGVPVDVITNGPAGLVPPASRRVAACDGVRLVRLPRLLVEPAAGAFLAAERGSLRGLVAVGVMMGAIAARLGRALDLPVVVKLACAGAAGDVAALLQLPPVDRARVLDDLRTTTLVVMTDELAREAAAIGLPRERMVAIPNGVDVAAVARAAPVRPAGDAPAALFLGRLAPAKDVDTLLRAFALVTAEVPAARLLLAGDGPERARLERLATELGLGERARFLGRRDDAAGLLRGATTTVLPSRCEGMSNALLEALAAGCPIVASAIDANRELLEGTGAALLVPPGDPSALAAALARVLVAPDLRARMALAATNAAARYEIDRVASEYLALLERLGPPRRRGHVRLARGYARARLDDVLRVLRRVVG